VSDTDGRLTFAYGGCVFEIPEGLAAPKKGSLFFCRNLAVTPHERVLEIGGGLGLAAVLMARAGARVVATDIVHEAVQTIRANARRNGVAVDVREMMGVLKQLRGQGGDADVVDAVDPGAMGDELLPDWYDDWVIVDRERLRQLRLHVLDSMCRQLSSRGLHFEAIDVGLMAIAAEPLRESAHRALIEAHLAERNVAEARRQYVSYALLLRDAGCGTPSPSLTQLLRGSGCEVAPLD